MKIVEYEKTFLSDAMRIWNEVVEEGVAFPQIDCLDSERVGDAFFSAQSYTGIAIDDNGDVVGLYILHPNNIGRCGHISNASYAVASECRGQGIGEKLVSDSLIRAKMQGFKIMQFNAVVSDNLSALSLYKKLGFTQLGVIPKGFLSKDEEYRDIVLHYITL